MTISERDFDALIERLGNLAENEITFRGITRDYMEGYGDGARYVQDGILEILAELDRRDQ